MPAAMEMPPSLAESAGGMREDGKNSNLNSNRKGRVVSVLCAVSLAWPPRADRSRYFSLLSLYDKPYERPTNAPAFLYGL